MNDARRNALLGALHRFADGVLESSLNGLVAPWTGAHDQSAVETTRRAVVDLVEEMLREDAATALAELTSTIRKTSGGTYPVPRAEEGEFHRGDGWTFERLPSGSVRMQLDGDDVAIISPAEWERGVRAAGSTAQQGDEAFADAQQVRIDELEDWQREVCRVLTPETEDRSDLSPDMIPTRIAELLEIERAHRAAATPARCDDLECYGVAHPADARCARHGLPLHAPALETVDAGAARASGQALTPATAGPTTQELAAMTRTLAGYYARGGAPTWATWLYAEARMFEKEVREDRDGGATPPAGREGPA